MELGLTMDAKKQHISDTVTVTPDGRSVVDIARLMATPKMQKTIAEIRAKISGSVPKRQPRP